eukprot:SAG31_NODE_497_length_14862_cov_6.951568_7_plen_81_part_00
MSCAVLPVRHVQAAAELVGQISGFLKAKEAMATDMITAEIQKLMEAEVDIPTPEGAHVDHKREIGEFVLDLAPAQDWTVQ